MSAASGELSTLVRQALESTRAIAVCPFHLDVTVRSLDDAAESHAWARARKAERRDGTKWKVEILREEFDRQLGNTADGYCPLCKHSNLIDPRQ
jgi:hypothetical protein